MRPRPDGTVAKETGSNRAKPVKRVVVSEAGQKLLLIRFI
jgi:hypothetical protein